VPPPSSPEDGTKHHVLYILEYWLMEKVQKLSNSEYYTPSSEPFRTYSTLSSTTVFTIQPFSFILLGPLVLSAKEKTSSYLLYINYYSLTGGIKIDNDEILHI
jgi:hypothetical protein